MARLVFTLAPAFSRREKGRPSESSHAQVLHLEELLDAVLGALAPDARLLDAAEGCHLVRDQTGVHANHARFDCLADAPDAADVARIEVRGETELGVVGHRYALCLGLEPVERSDGAERFLAGDLHAGVDP